MIKKLFYLLIAAVALVSCDFSDDDDCTYYGVLQASCDWRLVEEQVQPDNTDLFLVYYPVSGEATKTMSGASETFEEPVINRQLYTGSYNLLVFNKGVNKVRNTENPEAAEIYAETTLEYGKEVLKEDQSFIYAKFETGNNILADDTTRCVFVPHSLVQEIIVNLIVTGMKDQIPLLGVSGELDGVTTSRNLITGKKGVEYATKHFTLDLLDKPDQVFYSKSFLVLGINNIPDNNLTVTGDFGPGVQGQTTVSLNDILQDFNSDKIEITIEISVDPLLNLSAKIVSWIENDYGSFIIRQ